MVRIADPAALFQSVSDVSRLRLLRLLCRQELNVQELVRITGLSQPRVSKHLSVLREQGWIGQRREGTWSWYRAVEPAMFGPGDVLFTQVATAADELPQAGADDRTLAVVLADRRAGSRDFFSGLADHWDDIRLEYEHEDIRLGALGALVDEGLHVLDIGTGTGAMLPVFAAAVADVMAVDISSSMLARARNLSRDEKLANVRFCNADLIQLPFAAGTFDACHCAMALHHVDNPVEAMAEMARVVRPGGRIMLTAFVPHRQTWMRDELAHRCLGFARDEIEDHMRRVGIRPRGYLVRTKSAGGEGHAAAQAPGSGLVWPDVFLATGTIPPARRRRNAETDSHEERAIEPRVDQTEKGDR